MASNFAFQPFGLSRTLTVGGAAPVTVSLAVVKLGGTTIAPVPSSVRVVNEGTASVFLQFGASATGLTVVATTGMKMRANTEGVFGMKGQSVLAAVCASTFTVTLNVAVGEGI